MSKRRQKSKDAHHVRLYDWLLHSAAYRSLSAVARALYTELADRHFGNNNGHIAFSVRQAEDALHVGKSTAGRAFEELQKRGFIIAERKGGFNLKERKGQATEWRLTEFWCGLQAPTKEFMRWRSPEDDLPTMKVPTARSSARKATPASPSLVGSGSDSPLVNYKRTCSGTITGGELQIESLQRDQNVPSLQHLSHHRDQLVPPQGPDVPLQVPCSKSSAARKRLAGGSA